MKFNIIGLVVIILITACNTVKTTNNQNVTCLSSKIDSIAEANHFNGVILLAEDSIIQYEKAFGYSNLENKIKLSTNDQFYIGSISKQITAVLVLREYENGKLNLGDKINKYLPQISQPWANEVTIHHLLTHTHGIVAVDAPLESELGTQFRYSQIGFGLLAQVLERINHKSFEKISTEFFTEYALNNTFHPDNKNYTNLVNGYEEDETGKILIAEGNPVKYIAAGGFISNVEDLLTWNILLHSGKLVKPSTLDLMKTQYATRVHPILDKLEYGYGLVFKDGERNIQIGAFGYAPGFPSASYFYPQTDLNLIILGNIGVNLDDFKVTFKTQTDLMNLIKIEHPTPHK